MSWMVGNKKVKNAGGETMDMLNIQRIVSQPKNSSVGTITPFEVNISPKNLAKRGQTPEQYGQGVYARQVIKNQERNARNVQRLANRQNAVQQNPMDVSVYPGGRRKSSIG